MADSFNRLLVYKLRGMNVNGLRFCCVYDFFSKIFLVEALLLQVLLFLCCTVLRRRAAKLAPVLVVRSIP